MTTETLNPSGIGYRPSCRQAASPKRRRSSSSRSAGDSFSCSTRRSSCMSLSGSEVRGDIGPPDENAAPRRGPARRRLGPDYRRSTRRRSRRLSPARLASPFGGVYYDQPTRAPVRTATMLQRKYLFPRVIEMNYQAGRRLGVNVYLIDGGSEFVLIDIGYLDTVEEIIELVRRMDFNLSTCKMLIATHADADHIQGLARARELLRTKAAAHPLSVAPIETGDEVLTYASIKAQGIELPMPRCKIDL